MNTIWKFQLPRREWPYAHVEMPKGAKPLTMQVDGKTGEPCIWALVSPRAERVERHFVFVGTGHPAEGLDARDYRGTFQESGFVWHVFECADNRGGE